MWIPECLSLVFHWFVLMFSSILDNYLTVYFCIICCCLSVCAEDTVILFSLSFMCNGSKVASQRSFGNTDVKLQFYILWLINGYIQVLNNEIQQICMDGLQYRTLILMFVALSYAHKFRITHVNLNVYSLPILSLAERFKVQEIMENFPLCLYISLMIILQYFPCLKSTYLFNEQHCMRKGNLLRYYYDNNKIQCIIYETVDRFKFHFKFLALFTSSYSILCAGTRTASLLVGIHLATIRRISPLT